MRNLHVEMLQDLNVAYSLRRDPLALAPPRATPTLTLSSPTPPDTAQPAVAAPTEQR